MKGLDAAAATHIGRVRKRNEDAHHKGDSVFAVADGMGGALAGDVASHLALEPVSRLDGRVYPDAATARSALLEAALRANVEVVSRAAGSEELKGMGTTLTVALVEGQRLHVAHVGDSRAYLFRDGQFIQLTRDHTLVARLIEEGRLTEEEAASHPQRSIITRAVGVEADVDIDTLTLDLEAGDQILICSDGLTGPVSDHEIEEVLARDQPVEEAVQELVDLANHHGGPDNITVLLLRWTDEGPVGKTTVIRSRETSTRPSDDEWARAIVRLGALGRSPEPAYGGEGDRRGPTRAQRALAIAAGVAFLAALAVAGTWLLLSRSYFVGLDGDQVVIFRGVPAAVGPIDLFWATEVTELTLDDVAPVHAALLRQGIPAADLVDARQIVRNMDRRPQAARAPPVTAWRDGWPGQGPEASP